MNLHENRKIFPPSANTAISVSVSVPHHTSAVPDRCGLGEDVISAPSHQGQHVPRFLTPQQELSSLSAVAPRTPGLHGSLRKGLWAQNETNIYRQSKDQFKDNEPLKPPRSHLSVAIKVE